MEFGSELVSCGMFCECLYFLNAKIIGYIEAKSTSLPSQERCSCFLGLVGYVLVAVLKI